jgi:hypothetical protein
MLGTPWVATIEATAMGNTTIHTPTAGYRFQLMGFVVNVPAGLISAGTTIIQIYDAANLISEVVTVKGTQANAVSCSCDLSSIGGYISTADNALLICDLIGAAFTTLDASVTAWGLDV